MNMFVRSKEFKIMIGSLLFVILAAAGIYGAGKYYADDDRLIERFEQAVQSGKSDKLYQLLGPANEEVKFEQKTADDMVAYLQANSSVLAQVIQQLELQSEQLSTGEKEAQAGNDEGAFLYLNKKAGKRWIIFDDYELQVKRYMVPVQANFEGVRILVNGKEAGALDKVEDQLQVGPLLPGEHTIEAVYEGEYTTLKKVEKLSLFPLAGYEDRVELVLEGEYVNITSNNPDARIFINGVNIELKVESGQRIGPIAVDGSNTLFLEAAYPWATVLSDETPIDAVEQEIQLEALNDAEKENIMGATHEFVESWMKSLQALDPNRLLRASSDRIADIANYIEIMKVNGQQYIGTLQKMIIDRNSLVLVPLSDGGYLVQLKAQVDFSEITYHKLDNLNPVPIEGTMTNEYELVYDDGQWMVTNWYEAGRISTDNTKIFE
jgi:uncharacterized membrane protein YvbJ